jgi:5-carboxymethyl-2-hydroxymuconate isomerase
MPHITVEYSANLEKDIDIPALVHGIHQAVLASGVFEIGAVRTRAERRDVYEIADGAADNGFIHIEVDIAPGRDVTARQRVASAIMDAVSRATTTVFARSGLALSVEVREIDNSAALRLNNLHERMAAKGETRRGAS